MTPDEAAARITASFPDLACSSVVPVPQQGWDFHTFTINDGWIFRFPRSEDARRALVLEIALLPDISATLPTSVPKPVYIDPAGAFAGYRRIDGEQVGTDPAPSVAVALGGALTVLHAMDIAPALAAGVDGGYRPDDASVLGALRDAVLPHLTADERSRGTRLFDEIISCVDRAPRGLRHTDLGPAHVLVIDDALSGIIDWGDLSVGDPALDLAWALSATPTRFADAFAQGYGSIDAATRRRATLHWANGPWHEVGYGLRTGRSAFIETGLEGVRARLPA